MEHTKLRSFVEEKVHAVPLFWEIISTEISWFFQTGEAPQGALDETEILVKFVHNVNVYWANLIWDRLRGFSAHQREKTMRELFWNWVLHNFSCTKVNQKAAHKVHTRCSYQAGSTNKESNYQAKTKTNPEKTWANWGELERREGSEC